MKRIVVVGSGASGVHFARVALRKGLRVLMIDVGRQAAAHVRPEDSLVDLKRNLDDPAAYFLGTSYESLILPGHDGEYYGFPPSKTHVFEPHALFSSRSSGFAPLVSFASGGLAEAWTGGSYPFHDGDLEAFPFGYKALEPYYEDVARNIGISGAADDLARLYPVHGGLQEAPELDEHAKLLLAAYEKKRARLNRDWRCYMGRARLAVLTRDLDGRKACTYSGRCLWGCPRKALYTPSATLEQMRCHPNFEYLPGVFVTHFRFDSGSRVRSVSAVSAQSGERHEIAADAVVLAAGTLCSSMIFLRSIYEDSGERVTLRGLMDNRQVLMPFVNLKMIGRRWEPNSYQYHQLVIGVEGAGPMDYVHGLVTTLKTALIHPIVQQIPFDLGSAVQAFRSLHAALGLVNINFSDHRRPENQVTLDISGAQPRLAIHYQPDAGEPRRLAQTAKTFRGLLRKLGCIAPRPMTHIRPMGASVHYAGTIPMSESGGPLTATPSCRSRDFTNLYFADGTTFPSLPAKNLTFTLMANAARVAAEAFG